MYSVTQHRAWRVLSSVIVLILTLSLILSPSASYAQSLALPVPGAMVTPTPAYVPVLLKGMTVYPDNPLKFDFIVDSGNWSDNPSSIDDQRSTNNDPLKKESKRLIKYFLASLTVPQDELWVNLSPQEKDRIVPDALGETELGRDLLAQDYLLKQLTASLMYPEDDLGRKFWQKIYKEAYEKYGTTDIPVDTFNKVWIIPESAMVYENGNTVYVVESKLKVMLEQDYLSSQKSVDSSQGKNLTTDNSPLATQIVRELILPAIEKEVNEGQTFAPLRQIYNSLILAKWYKDTVKNSILSQVYVDQNKTAGITNDDPKMKEKIYAQYMAAYKKGVYNYIKDEYDPATKDIIPRKYFSGGFSEGDLRIKQEILPFQKTKPVGDFSMITTDLREKTDQAMTGDVLKFLGDLYVAELVLFFAGFALDYYLNYDSKINVQNKIVKYKSENRALLKEIANIVPEKLYQHNRFKVIGSLLLDIIDLKNQGFSSVIEYWQLEGRMIDVSLDDSQKNQKKKFFIPKVSEKFNVISGQALKKGQPLVTLKVMNPDAPEIPKGFMDQAMLATLTAITALTLGFLALDKTILKRFKQDNEYPQSFKLVLLTVSAVLFSILLVCKDGNPHKIPEIFQAIRHYSWYVTIPIIVLSSIILYPKVIDQDRNVLDNPYRFSEEERARAIKNIRYSPQKTDEDTERFYNLILKGYNVKPALNALVDMKTKRTGEMKKIVDDLRIKIARITLRKGDLKYIEGKIHEFLPKALQLRNLRNDFKIVRRFNEDKHKFAGAIKKNNDISKWAVLKEGRIFEEGDIGFSSKKDWNKKNEVLEIVRAGAIEDNAMLGEGGASKTIIMFFLLTTLPFITGAIDKNASIFNDPDLKVNAPIEENLRDESVSFIYSLAANENILRHYLSMGMDINVRGADGGTALHKAVKYWDIQRASVLIKNGIDINVQDEKELTALYLAVYYNDTDMVEFLLKNNAEIDIHPRQYPHPLLIAANYHYTKALKLLLKYGVDVNFKGLLGETALHLACQNYYFDVFLVLMAQESIDVNIQNINGVTPLMVAVDAQNIGMVRELLAREGIKVNLEDKGGFTALSYAKYTGNETIIQMLEEKGAKEGKVISISDGATPVEDSAMLGNFSKTFVLLMLLTSPLFLMGAKTPVFYPASYSESYSISKKKFDRQLINAIRADNFSQFSSLLHIIKDSSLKKQYKEHSFIIACDMGKKNMVNAFLAMEDEIDVNYAGEYGQTGLHRACLWGHTDIVKILLLNKNVDIKARDENGLTALMIAAFQGYEDIVGLILDDPRVDKEYINAKDNDRNTAWDKAHDKGYREIEKLLEKHGAVKKYRVQGSLSDVTNSHKDHAMSALRGFEGIGGKEEDGVLSIKGAGKKKKTDTLHTQYSILNPPKTDSAMAGNNKKHPFDYIREDKNVRDFVTKVLRRRYLSWNLPEGLANTIIDTIIIANKSPQEIRNFYLKDIFESPLWKSTYKIYQSTVKQDIAFDTLNEHLRSLPKDSIIVDVGAGDNALAKRLGKEFPDLRFIGTDEYGYDGDYEQGNVSFKKQNRPDKLEKFESGSVSVVILNKVLHHAEYRTMERLLDEIYRILKLGGKVFLFEATYPTSNEDMVKDSKYVDVELTQEFNNLIDKYGEEFAYKVISFIDYYGNIFAGNITEMSIAHNYHSIKNWVKIFEEYIGLKKESAKYFGIEARAYHRTPLGVMTFVKDHAMGTDARLGYQGFSDQISFEKVERLMQGFMDDLPPGDFFKKNKFTIEVLQGDDFKNLPPAKKGDPARFYIRFLSDIEGLSNRDKREKVEYEFMDEFTRLSYQLMEYLDRYQLRLHPYTEGGSVIREGDGVNRIVEYIAVEEKILSEEEKKSIAFEQELLSQIEKLNQLYLHDMENVSIREGLIRAHFLLYQHYNLIGKPKDMLAHAHIALKIRLSSMKFGFRDAQTYHFMAYELIKDQIDFGADDMRAWMIEDLVKDIKSDPMNPLKHFKLGAYYMFQARNEGKQKDSSIIMLDGLTYEERQQKSIASNEENAMRSFQKVIEFSKARLEHNVKVLSDIIEHSPMETKKQEILEIFDSLPPALYGKNLPLIKKNIRRKTVEELMDPLAIEELKYAVHIPFNEKFDYDFFKMMALHLLHWDEAKKFILKSPHILRKEGLIPVLQGFYKISVDPKSEPRHLSDDEIEEVLRGVRDKFENKIDKGVWKDAISLLETYDPRGLDFMIGVEGAMISETIREVTGAQEIYVAHKKDQAMGVTRGNINVKKDDGRRTKDVYFRIKRPSSLIPHSLEKDSINSDFAMAVDERYHNLSPLRREQFFEFLKPVLREHKRLSLSQIYEILQETIEEGKYTQFAYLFEEVVEAVLDGFVIKDKLLIKDEKGSYSLVNLGKSYDIISSESKFNQIPRKEMHINDMMLYDYILEKKGFEAFTWTEIEKMLDDEMNPLVFHNVFNLIRSLIQSGWTEGVAGSKIELRLLKEIDPSDALMNQTHATVTEEGLSPSALSAEELNELIAPVYELIVEKDFREFQVNSILSQLGIPGNKYLRFPEVFNAIERNIYKILNELIIREKIRISDPGVYALIDPNEEKESQANIEEIQKLATKVYDIVLFLNMEYFHRKEIFEAAEHFQNISSKDSQYRAIGLNINRILTYLVKVKRIQISGEYEFSVADPDQALDIIPKEKVEEEITEQDLEGFYNFLVYFYEKDGLAFSPKGVLLKIKQNNEGDAYKSREDYTEADVKKRCEMLFFRGLLRYVNAKGDAYKLTGKRKKIDTDGVNMDNVYAVVDGVLNDIVLWLVGDPNYKRDSYMNFVNPMDHYKGDNIDISAKALEILDQEFPALQEAHVALSYSLRNIEKSQKIVKQLFTWALNQKKKPAIFAKEIEGISVEEIMRFMVKSDDEKINEIEIGIKRLVNKDKSADLKKVEKDLKKQLTILKNFRGYKGKFNDSTIKDFNDKYLKAILQFPGRPLIEAEKYFKRIRKIVFGWIELAKKGEMSIIDLKKKANLIKDGILIERVPFGSSEVRIEIPPLIAEKLAVKKSHELLEENKVRLRKIIYNYTDQKRREASHGKLDRSQFVPSDQAFAYLMYLLERQKPSLKAQAIEAINNKNIDEYLKLRAQIRNMDGLVLLPGKIDKFGNKVDGHKEKYEKAISFLDELDSQAQELLSEHKGLNDIRNAIENKNKILWVEIIGVIKGESVSDNEYIVLCEGIEGRVEYWSGPSGIRGIREMRELIGKKYPAIVKKINENEQIPTAKFDIADAIDIQLQNEFREAFEEQRTEKVMVDKVVRIREGTYGFNVTWTSPSGLKHKEFMHPAMLLKSIPKDDNMYDYKGKEIEVVVVRDRKKKVDYVTDEVTYEEKWNFNMNLVPDTLKPELKTKLKSLKESEEIVSVQIQKIIEMPQGRHAIEAVWQDSQGMGYQAFVHFRYIPKEMDAMLEYNKKVDAVVIWDEREGFYTFSLEKAFEKKNKARLHDELLELGKKQETLRLKAIHRHRRGFMVKYKGSQYLAEWWFDEHTKSIDSESIVGQVIKVTVMLNDEGEPYFKADDLEIEQKMSEARKKREAARQKRIAELASFNKPRTRPSFGEFLKQQIMPNALGEKLRAALDAKQNAETASDEEKIFTSKEAFQELNMILQKIPSTSGDKNRGSIFWIGLTGVDGKFITIKKIFGEKRKDDFFKVEDAHGLELFSVGNSKDSPWDEQKQHEFGSLITALQKMPKKTASEEGQDTFNLDGDTNKVSKQGMSSQDAFRQVEKLLNLLQPAYGGKVVDRTFWLSVARYVGDSVNVRKVLGEKPSDTGIVFETSGMARLLTLKDDGSVVLTEREQAMFRELLTQLNLKVEKESKEMLGTVPEGGLSPSVSEKPVLREGAASLGDVQESPDKNASKFFQGKSEKGSIFYQRLKKYLDHVKPDEEEEEYTAWTKIVQWGDNTVTIYQPTPEKRKDGRDVFVVIDAENYLQLLKVYEDEVFSPFGKWDPKKAFEGLSMALNGKYPIDDSAMSAAGVGEAVIFITLVTGLYSFVDKKYPSFFTAAKSGNVEALEKFIEKGTDVDKFSPLGFTALNLAVSNEQYAAAEFLLENQANPNLGREFSSKVHEMDLRKNPEVKLGAFNLPDTPLITAILKQNRPLVRLLLTYKADPNYLMDDLSPLFIASGLRKIKIVRALLLSKEADINLGDRQTSMTPIMRACQNKRYSTAEFLLRRGADITLEDEDGKTARDYLLAGETDDRKFEVILKEKRQTQRDEMNGLGSQRETDAAMQGVEQFDFVIRKGELQDIGTDSQKKAWRTITINPKDENALSKVYEIADMADVEDIDFDSLKQHPPVWIAKMDAQTVFNLFDYVAFSADFSAMDVAGIYFPSANQLILFREGQKGMIQLDEYRSFRDVIAPALEMKSGWDAQTAFLPKERDAIFVQPVGKPYVEMWMAFKRDHAMRSFDSAMASDQDIARDVQENVARLRSLKQDADVGLKELKGIEAKRRAGKTAVTSSDMLTLIKSFSILYQAKKEGIEPESDQAMGVGREALIDNRLLNNDQSSTIDNPGGIDMNYIEINRTQDVHQILFDPQVIENIISPNFQGFEPVIINIRPILNILPLLGLDKEKNAPMQISQREQYAKEPQTKIN